MEKEIENDDDLFLMEEKVMFSHVGLRAARVCGAKSKEDPPVVRSSSIISKSLSAGEKPVQKKGELVAPAQHSLRPFARGTTTDD